MNDNVYEFPDSTQIDIRRPLGAPPDAKYLAVRINDNAFSGALGRGQIAVVEEGRIKLPGYHAARLRSGLIVVRYGIELPENKFRLFASNRDYPPLDESQASLVGRVQQMAGNGQSDEHWELISPTVAPAVLLEWALSMLI